MWAATKYPAKARSTHLHGSSVMHPKLKIGGTDDKYEREADRVAERMMRMPENQIQRPPVEEEEEEIMQMRTTDEEEELQMQPMEEEVDSLI